MRPPDHRLSPSFQPFEHTHRQCRRHLNHKRLQTAHLEAIIRRLEVGVLEKWDVLVFYRSRWVKRHFGFACFCFPFAGLASPPPRPTDLTFIFRLHVFMVFQASFWHSTSIALIITLLCPPPRCFLSSVFSSSSTFRTPRPFPTPPPLPPQHWSPGPRPMQRHTQYHRQGLTL